MKEKLIVLLATTSLAFAGGDKAVDVGSFDYRGRSFVNAKAIVISPNEVKANVIAIPWDKLNASVQFRLKPMREKSLLSRRKSIWRRKKGKSWYPAG
jgi:hypothetical protein